MSLKERDRLVLLRQIQEGALTLAEGARRLKLGTRHLRRLMRRFEAEGDAALVHRARGRPSNHRLPEAVRIRALARAREAVFHDFGPTLLAEHLSRDPEIGPLKSPTLRRWMIEEGLWSPRERKLSHRTRRERRAARGELIQMDTSIHAWLEARSEEEIVLIALIDDATSQLYARFVPRDTGVANRQMIVDYLTRFGRPVAFYTDRASHFEAHFRARERRDEGKEKALTLIRRALDALGVELILALSPQAKGRVERLFKTLQDRLLKEMRVRGIASLENANRFLDEAFVPFWNERFAVEPASAVDAHRPLPEEVDLLRLFAETETRVIRNDFTLRYRNNHLQIRRSEADAAMPGSRVSIERRTDGSTRYRWNERYLALTPAARAELHPAQPAVAAVAAVLPGPLAERPKPLRPAADHPWRKHPVRVGRARFTAASGVASAPAALRPDSPPPGEVVSISP